MRVDKEFCQALPYAVVGAAQGAYEYYVKPTVRENQGTVAWGVLGAGVVSYDLLTSPGNTLSEVFRRQPLALQVGELALLSFHLLGVDPNHDPIHLAYKAIKGGER